MRQTLVRRHSNAVDGRGISFDEGGAKTLGTVGGDVAVLAGAVEADCDRSLVRPEMGDGIEVVVEPLGVAVRFPLVD